MSENVTQIIKVKPGQGVLLEVEIRHRGPEKTTTGELIVKQTVNHEVVTEYDELSITGECSRSSGQCVDSIREMFADNAAVLELCDIWDRWHLNDLRPGCAHQKTGDYSDAAINLQICELAHVCRPDGVARDPHDGGRTCRACGKIRGYAYGSAWLVEPLPAEVKARVVELCTAINLAGPGRGGAKDAAVDFLNNFDLTLKGTHKGDKKCPPWGGSYNLKGEHPDACAKCGNVHGNHYRITIKRNNRDRMHAHSISFDFWNSANARSNGSEPSPYDVLACVSSDASCPTTAAEVCREFGYDEDSRKDYATAERVAKFAGRLQAFFTADELEALGEIQ